MNSRSPQKKASIPGAAPKVMTSASESYSLPNSLSVPVMRAIRPSTLSRTAASRMKTSRPVEVAVEAADDGVEAEDHVAHGEQAGQQVGAAPDAGAPAARTGLPSLGQRVPSPGIATGVAPFFRRSPFFTSTR